MTYYDFNRAVFEFYQNRSTSSYCLLALTQKELEEIIPISEIANFDVLKRDWELLLTGAGDLPKYFGLIAIQCYAASLMRKDYEHSEAAYNIRLCEILGISDVQELQRLFKGKVPNNPTQEKIWFGAKDFLSRKLGQNLEIPARSSYAGRYVQFPKSQALLNLEDLKKFTVVFRDHFRPNEDVSFKYFENYIISNLHAVALSQRAKEIINDAQKSKQCIQQLYDYFNSWQGEVFDTRLSQKKTKPQIKATTKFNSLLLNLEEGEPQFFLFDNQGQKVIGSIDASSVFENTSIFHFHQGLAIFSKTYYPNDYELSRFIDPESEGFVLIEKSKSLKLFNFFQANSIQRIQINSALYLFKYSYSEEHYLIAHLIDSVYPVKFLGGIRLGRLRKYVVGFGPELVSKSRISVVYNNFLSDYDSRNALPGIYKVRVNGFKERLFEIVPNSTECRQLKSRGVGWSLEEYRVSDDFHLEGVRMQFPKKKTTLVREWINVNLKLKEKEEISSNILIKAIKNSAK